MEYYPLKDTTVEQYWKLKVTDGMLHLEENSQAECQDNPIINDKDGTTWILSVDNGCLALTDTTPQPDTQFYFHDPAGDVWRVIADHGIIGIEKIYGKAQPVLQLSYNPLGVGSGKWTDPSKFGNHGTPYGGARPVMICPGVMGFEFDGSNGYVDCGSDESLNITAEGTLICWFKAFRNNVIQALVAKQESTYEYTTSYALRLYYNKFDVRLGDGSNLQDVFYAGVETDKWCMFAGVWDGTSIELYVDGELKEVNSQAITPYVNTVSLTMSTEATTRVHFFNGLIAQPRIYNRALSADEIRENMYKSPIYRMLRGLPKSLYI